MTTQKSLQKNIEAFARQYVDKLLHFIIGYIAFTVSYLMLEILIGGAAGISALCFVILLALAKELYDCKREGATGFGWIDFLVTSSGAMPAFLILI